MGTDASIDIATRISGATTDIATRVTGAIRDAARVTGAGFEYLLNTAIRESNLNPNAKAKTSSATGLFQFIDQTWLGTMKQSGASLGYGKYADAISRTSSGPLRRQRSGDAQRDLRAAQGPDRELDDGGCLRQFECQGADRPARPQADRRRALHGAFSRRVGRVALHPRGRGQSERQGGGVLPARRARQQLDLLRQGRSGAQPEAGLCGTRLAPQRDRQHADRGGEVLRCGSVCQPGGAAAARAAAAA